MRNILGILRYNKITAGSILGADVWSTARRVERDRTERESWTENETDKGRDSEGGKGKEGWAEGERGREGGTEGRRGRVVSTCVPVLFVF